jgi:hypothetical protein
VGVLDGKLMDGATVLKNTRDFAPGPHRITSKLITKAEVLYSSKTVKFIVNLLKGVFYENTKKQQKLVLMAAGFIVLLTGCHPLSSREAPAIRRS